MDTKAVIFDIDGTLTEYTSWVSLTEGLGASVEAHDVIYQAYLSEAITYEESKERLVSLWRATGKADQQTMASIFGKIPLRENAVETVNGLTEKGYLTCLITGSMDLYAAAVASKFKATEWYANTHLIFDDQGMVIDYDYHRDQVAKKIEHLTDFCERHAIRPNQCAVVGNGENDAGIFALTGNGIQFGSELERVLPGVNHKIGDLGELLSVLETGAVERI